MGKRRKGKGRDANKTGRSERPDRFIQFPYYMLESPAFRALSGGAVKTLIYMLKRFDGSNNGSIGFGARSGCFIRDPNDKSKLADVTYGLGPTATADNLFELQAAGFIACTRESEWTGTRGTTGQGVVREWRLTWLECDGPATKEFTTRTGPFRRPKGQKSKLALTSAQADYQPSNSPLQRTANQPGAPTNTPNSPAERTDTHRDSPLERTHLVTIPNDRHADMLEAKLGPEAGP